MTLRPGVWVAVAVAVAAGELIVVAPNVAWPFAVFVIEPASRSAWLITWLAEQVIVALGAMLVGLAGQVGVALSSVTVNGENRVTLPVFLST